MPEWLSKLMGEYEWEIWNSSSYQYPVKVLLNHPDYIGKCVIYSKKLKRGFVHSMDKNPNKRVICEYTGAIQCYG